MYADWANPGVAKADARIRPSKAKCRSICIDERPADKFPKIVKSVLKGPGLEACT